MPQVGWQRIRFADPEEGPDPAMAFSTNMPDGNRLVVAADLEPVEAMDETVVAIFATGALAVLALGALLALGLTRYLKRRLETIAVGSRAFAAGDYSGRARVGSSDDEFDQLAQTLNSMLDRIAALLANLKQVTSDLAHDMRTPLTNLRNQLEGLLHAPVAERAARTDAAIEKCDDILRLFAAILRISELEGGELRRRFTGVDLGSLVKEIVEAHEPLAEESGHILVSADGAALGEVSGDRELLAQALVNLVENALHHTSAGTNIEIGTVAGSVAPVLYVRDDGPGIAEAYRDRVTQRFVRLDASRSSTGHGLGLSMVKAIATAHGAEMELRDANPGLEPLEIEAAQSSLAAPVRQVLEQRANNIDRPWLASVMVDLSAPLTPDAISALAVANNPDLVAMRARAHVAGAQVFAAGLLPDPTFSVGTNKVLSGPDTMLDLSGALGF
ncbi:hypothetical protein A4X03_0g9378, partial [Tilletia caries]